MPLKIYELPFDTKITYDEEGVFCIKSNISETLPSIGDDNSDPIFPDQIIENALESFLLNMAVEGMQMNDQRISKALKKTVEDLQLL